MDIAMVWEKQCTVLFEMEWIVRLNRDEDGAWIAECPSIPGCVSQGSSMRKALENIKEAIRLCLEVCKEQNIHPVSR